MSFITKNILATNKSLFLQREAQIQFDIDHEGKSILNKQISKFYESQPLDKTQIVDIIVTSSVIIVKMSKLNRSGWKISELKEQLNKGIKRYVNRFDIDLEELFDNEANDGTDFKTDLNEKYPAKLKSNDGHYVRSKAELLIDNFLFTNGIIHPYEKRLPVDQFAYCDFYIPAGKGVNDPIYIEYWGLENERKYLDRKKQKIEIYRLKGLQLIEITEKDMQNLGDYLSDKLRTFQIII